MNMHSNTMSDSFDAQTAAPAALSSTRPMYWSVQRELWESRSIYIAPLAAAAVFLVGFLISLIHLPQRMRALSTLDLAQQREAIVLPYDMVAGLLMFTWMIVGAFYCLGALQGERRDRSILFWKSLPVSDLTTVMAKATLPMVILPVVTFVVISAAQLVILAASLAILPSVGFPATMLWTQFPLLSTWLGLAYILVCLALWHAPIWGWLMLVSGW